MTGHLPPIVKAAERLCVELKAEQRLQRLTDGIDFLGYVVRPTHTLVRPRVVAHARAALSDWETDHVRRGRIRATGEQRQQIRAVVASYRGHFAHAHHHRLMHSLRKRFPWLEQV